MFQAGFACEEERWSQKGRMTAAIEAYRDEIAGAISKLCSLSCNDEAKLKHARDTLKRISLRQHQGYNLYDDVKEAVLRRFSEVFLLSLPCFFSKKKLYSTAVSQ